jgi:predicted AAA+ superfamily ATPase
MELLRLDIEKLKIKLKRAPAVVILGPRQVGKTTFAIQAAKASGKDYIYLDIESGQDVAKIGDDPEQFFDFHKDKLVILDEVQIMPVLFSRLRSIIDRNRTEGRFMLLGSASPNLVHGVSESLAGRVSYIDLPALRLQEVSPQYSQFQHWYRGGFPRAFLAKEDSEYLDWMESYIRSYIQTDLSVLFGYNLNPMITRKLWYMLAHNHGQIVNMQDISRSVGVTSPVINRYIDFLEGAFLIYKLSPWSSNSSKRLVKSPKIYIKDSGILHALIGIDSLDKLTLHPIVGASWEGYAIEQIMYHAPENLSFYYYRTHTGTEIDLVVVKQGVPIAAIEIKFSNIPTPSKGFYIGIEDLKTTQNFILTPSSDFYPHKNAWVSSLEYFIKNHLPLL